MDENRRIQTIEESIANEFAHGITVSNLSFRVAKELGRSAEECYELAVAGLVHDIGKLEVSKYIYKREEDTLRIEELKYERTHSTIGYTMLSKYKYAPSVLETVLYHHENYDGSGYPANLAGEAIPLGARILRVCDVFAALTMDRPYRKAFDVGTAVELMIEEVKNFDLKVFLAFQNVIHEEGVENILDKEELLVEFEEDYYELEEETGDWNERHLAAGDGN